MEVLDKRLDECQQLQQPALDLSGLKIGPADANKVAAFIPNWWVEAILSPGVVKLCSMAVWRFVVRGINLGGLKS
jgi:hypothetical protein